MLQFYHKSLLEFLHETFYFLSWKSTKQWKNEILQKFNINFNGSEQSLSKLIKTVYSEENLNQKIVIVINAVSVSHNISVSKDGNATQSITNIFDSIR